MPGEGPGLGKPVRVIGDYVNGALHPMEELAEHRGKPGNVVVIVVRQQRNRDPRYPVLAQDIQDGLRLSGIYDDCSARLRANDHSGVTLAHIEAEDLHDLTRQD
ncbi:MAG: hypothetical protein FJ291_21395 [Planctomycetes bacterium]|nr:hypothetical protein [Planctomycetota bacterium]